MGLPLFFFLLWIQLTGSFSLEVGASNYKGKQRDPDEI